MRPLTEDFQLHEEGEANNYSSIRQRPQHRRLLLCCRSKCPSYRPRLRETWSRAASRLKRLPARGSLPRTGGRPGGRQIVCDLAGAARCLRGRARGGAEGGPGARDSARAAGLSSQCGGRPAEPVPLADAEANTISARCQSNGASSATKAPAQGGTELPSWDTFGGRRCACSAVSPGAASGRDRANPACSKSPSSGDTSDGLNSGRTMARSSSGRPG